MNVKVKLLVLLVASVQCLEDFGGGFVSSDSDENLDYVEGEFTRENNPAPLPSGFGDDTSNLFQHHFGAIFNGFNGFNGGDAFSPFGSFGGFGPFYNYKPWYKGENVCTTREEKFERDENSAENDTSTQLSQGFPTFSLNFESCSETNTKHICKRVTNQGGSKKTVTTITTCCHGFKRARSGFCEKFELLTVNQIGEELHSEQFVNSMEKNDLQEMMKANVTIFMPADESFTKFSQSVTDNNLDVANSDNASNGDFTMKEVLLNHMVRSIVDIEDIDNEQILYSELNNLTIRMNVFPKIRSKRNDDDFHYLYTANCVPIVKANKFAQNAIVHQTEKVLKPIRQNVMEIIRERDDLTILRTVLEKTGMDKVLEGSSADDENESKTETVNQFSIFAPTDSAFEKLDPRLKRKLKEGSACAKNILKNHIMDLTFCSAAVVDDEAKVSAFNMLGEKMIFERSETNGDNDKATNEISSDPDLKTILINGKARILEGDLMGTNGVVHIVDSVFETRSGLPITSLLDSRNLTYFKDLMEYGNLDDYFDNLENVTYFVPSNEALEASESGRFWVNLLKESPQKLKNNENLKSFISYHVVKPLLKSTDLTEKMMPTLMGGEPLRVNLYSTMPSFSKVANRATVNCARLIHFDFASCSSVLHQVDKVLTPASSNLLDNLQSNPQYSQFLKLVTKANLTSLLEDSTLTLFVPRNNVFEEVEEWMKDKSSAELEEIVKNHIIPEVICCSGIGQWPFTRNVMSISNNPLTLTRDRRPKVQNAAMTKCDIVSKNGIIHEVNDIIVVRPRQDPATQFYNTFFNRPFFFK